MLTEKRQKSAFASIRNASIYPRDASHSATLREHNHGLGGVVRYSGKHKGGHFVHLALPCLPLYKEATSHAIRPGACTYHTQLHWKVKVEILRDRGIVAYVCYIQPPADRFTLH